MLKSLESKKLIKSVKCVNATKKKVYMLYDLEPDRSVTGKPIIFLPHCRICSFVLLTFVFVSFFFRGYKLQSHQRIITVKFGR